MASRDTKLNIIVDAQDKTQGTFKNLNAQMGNVEKSSSSLLSTLSKVGMAAGAAAVGLLSYGVKVAADLQTAQVGLTTLLGSTEKAAATMDRLKKEAARTPFELPGLSQATQLLTSVTKDGDKSIDILLDVGEALAAMGKGQPELDRIIVNLQQVASVGKASMIDIKQFAFAGIPIFEMLEDHFKKGSVALVDNSKKMSKNSEELKKLQGQLQVASQRQEEFTSKTSKATQMANSQKIEELRGKISALNGTMSSLSATNGKAATSIVNVGDAIENGEVTFELLTQLFDKANDEGGKFFNAYKNQAGTFNQAMSNMKDSIGIFFADITTGTGIFNGLTQAMIFASDILGNYQKHLENIKIKARELMSTLDEKTGLETMLKDSWANLVMVFNEQLKPALMELWVALQPYKPYLEALAKVLGVMLVIAIGAAIMIIGALAAGLVHLLAIATEVSTFFLGNFVKMWDFIIDKISDVIIWVEKLISKFQRAMDMASKVTGGVVGKTVNFVSKVVGVDDAVIAPNGKIISTHPDDYLIATKNPKSLGGGGVTINITGNTLLDEDAAEKMGDLIFSRLRLSNAI